MKRNDSPIKHTKDDSLGRDNYAQLIAGELDQLDASDGVVAALTGPWGIGKTSFFHLIQSHLPAHVTSWEFNPWFYSQSEELLSRFLIEFSRKLSGGDSSQKKAAKKIRTLGRVLQPIEVIPVAGPKAKAARGAIQATADLLDPKRDVFELKSAVDKLLKNTDQKFLIFVDDVDRLEEEEIKDILKLVRLVASFRNVIFLLAFDEQRVIEALGSDPKWGQAYLEKIVFVSYRIPDVNWRQIQSELRVGLRELHIINEVNLPRVDCAMENFLLPSIDNVRKAKRFLASLRLAFAKHAREVDAVDLLLIEAVRVVKPDLFRMIVEHQFALSWSVYDVEFMNDARKIKSRTAIQQILQWDDSDEVSWVIRELFPMAWRAFDDRNGDATYPSRLIANQRLGHRDILQRVLDQHHGPESLARQKLDDVKRIASSRFEVDSLFAELPIEEAELVAEMIPEVVEELPPSGQEVLVSALFDLASAHYQSSRFFSLGIPQAARQTLYELWKDGSKTKEWLEICLDGIVAWKARFLFMRTIEPQEGDPAPPVSRVLYEEILPHYREYVLSLSEEQLTTDAWSAILIIDAMERASIDRQELGNLLKSPVTAWGLARSSVQSVVNNQKPNGIGWMARNDLLERILGNREQIMKLVEICEKNPSDNHDDMDMITAIRSELEQSAG